MELRTWTGSVHTIISNNVVYVVISLWITTSHLIRDNGCEEAEEIAKG